MATNPFAHVATSTVHSTGEGEGEGEEGGGGIQENKNLPSIEAVIAAFETRWQNGWVTTEAAALTL